MAKFPTEAAIGGVFEIIKIGLSIIEKRNNGTLTQEQFDAEWAKMQVPFKANDDAWLASKQARGQT